MKKNYTTPIIKEIKIELEDVIAASVDKSLGGSRPGDSSVPFGNLFK